MSKRKRVMADDQDDHRPTSTMRSDSAQTATSGPVDANFSSPTDSFGQLSNVANFQALQAHNASHGQQVDSRNGNAATTATTTSATDTAAAALASHYQMSLPQSAEALFQSPNGHESPGVHSATQDMSFGFSLDGKMDPASGHDDGMAAPQMMAPATPSTHGGPNPTDSPSLLLSASAILTPREKPVVGTDEWHKLRRDNHKEVERRRRETINEGISELSKIVPGCEKNKGQILARAVAYITQLKDNESQNVEKWTLEKLLTEQAISELSATVDDLKNKLNDAWGEIDRLKSVCDKAGIDPSDRDKR